MKELLYTSRPLTAVGAFTDGIEGPACDIQGNLYVVNFKRYGTIGRVAPDGSCSLFLELPEGSIGNGIRFARDGTMFVADYVHHTIFQVELSTRRVSVYARESAMHQPNDLAITSDGRLYASDPCWSNNTGRLWQIERGGVPQLLEDTMGTTNGIEVSPDERTLYVNETVQRTIWAYTLAPDGSIGDKRLVMQFSNFGLDGMRCDMDGNLFVTRYGKGTVEIISPQGEVIREVALLGRNCTNLTFGGADGRTCYVTVADTGQVEWFRVPTPGRCWQLWRGR